MDDNSKTGNQQSQTQKVIPVKLAHLSAAQHKVFSTTSSMLQQAQAAPEEKVDSASETNITARKEKSIVKAPLPETNPQVIIFLKNLLRDNRTTLGYATNMPGAAKSHFLMIVQRYADKLQCGTKTSQIEPSHAPLFTAKVTLQSREYGNVVMTTQATARRKKEAEVQAFHKLVCLLVD